MPANDLIIFRKGTAAQWTSSNPTLASGEPGFDLTNSVFKIGDGVSNWESLSSHKHNISDINSFASGVADVLNTEMIGGSGISLIYNNQTNTITISVTGIVSGAGEVNSGPIAVADITDFNVGVSGLIENIYAPLSSPAFTGVPIVPTANSGSNNNQIANTQFVRNEIASVVNSAPEALDTLYELASALGSDSNFSTTVTNSLSNKASLSGAVFTGSVTIPSGSINATTLSVTGVPVSVSGHSHSSSDIIGLTSTIESTLDTSLVGGTGIVLSFDQNTQTLSINASNTGLSLSSTDSLPEGSSNLYFTNSRASGASPVQSVAGKTGVVTLSGSDVGLSNVDNTSDTNKPISLAVQSGLDLKAAAVHSHIISDISGLELSLSGKQPSGNYSTLDSSANFSSLTVNSTTVSLSGHSHSYSDITNFSSGVASSLSTELVGGSGISLVYDSNNNTVNISVTGIVGGGGTTGPIYTTGIVDFNTGVSGLLTDYAPLNSPALTGTPIAPTAPTGTNSNQIASTAFVRSEIANLVASAPSTLDTLNEIALSLNNDANFSSTIVSGLASKASLTGSVFTGSVTIPSGSINANTLTVDNIPVSISGHTHIASNISGLDTAIENKFDTSIAAGSGIALTYNSGSSTLTISATGVSSGGGSGLSWSNVPSGSTDTGTAGQIAYDDNYFYIAISTNTWKRAALSSWSPFSPMSVAGLQLWLDASDSSTLYDSTSGGNLVSPDGGVARWEDKSGNGRHFTQSTSGSRPQLKTAQQNGLATLLFDGTSDYMVGGDYLDLISSASMTLFFVYKRNIQNSYQNLINKYSSTEASSSSIDEGFVLAHFSDNKISSYAINNGQYTRVDTSSAISASSYTVVSLRISGNAVTSPQFQINATPAASTAALSNASSIPDTNYEWRIGSAKWQGNMGDFLSGNVAEVIIYNSLLSGTDLSAVESYLMMKWGI